MFIIDRYRRGAFTSLVKVEILWLTVLWILWLAIAADLAALTSGCLSFPSSPCLKGTVVAAFGFIIWIDLFTYTVLLLAIAIAAHVRGSPAWKTTVSDGFGSTTSLTPQPTLQITTVPLSDVPPPPPHSPLKRVIWQSVTKINGDQRGVNWSGAPEV